MDFTFEEIDELIKRGYLEKDKENTFGIDSIHKSTNQGFGYYSITKEDNGEIKYYCSEPTNVDPDDGSHDTEYITRKYKTFEDFMNHKPYFEEIK